jgi:delta-aminolevulinic acid dehydratase/porphobilinogen synthase
MDFSLCQSSRATKEALYVEEGADMVMVKPGIAYHCLRGKNAVHKIRNGIPCVSMSMLMIKAA